MTTPKLLTPPKGLSAEAKQFWTSLQSEYGIDDPAGLRYLMLAAESLDRMRAAQKEITKHGLLVTGRYGQLLRNPAATVERDARAAMLNALRALNLDIQPPAPRAKR